MIIAMHIPEHVLDPTTVAVTWGTAAICLGYALSRLRWTASERQVPLMGVVAAGIFAGQMVNFPILGVPASGHLLGGVLAGVLLGPWAGALAITAVLCVQCFLFADGGVSALGANILNMAVVGSMLGYAIYAGLRRLWSANAGVVLASAVASWLSVTLASVMFCVELAAGGETSFGDVLSPMLFYHVRIGLGEAVITGIVVAVVLRRRPELIYSSSHQAFEPQLRRNMVAGGLALALAVAMFAAPLASDLEDGLEAALVQLGIQSQESAIAAPFPDYAVRESLLPQSMAAEGPWTTAIMTALLGAVGTMVTWGVALGVARSMRTLQTGGRVA